MRLQSVTITLIAGALLSACSTNPGMDDVHHSSSLTLDSDLFGERPNMISVSEIHELSDEQALEFGRYLNDARNQNQPTHTLVSDYLETITDNFTYHGKTYTASETLDKSAGNCLSLAILTTALAKVAEVEIAYRLTDSLPVFESRDNLIRRELHVKSYLYDPTWEPQDGYLVLSRPGVIVDYFRNDSDRFIRNIDGSEYLSMYYRNMAVDAIQDENLSEAYWLLIRSLELSPLSADSLNMLAIVNDRAGDKSKSEEIYRFGIQNSPRQVSLLRNYGIFLRRQGRSAEAEEIGKTLSRLADPNPFDWILEGQNAYEANEFRRAIGFFRKGADLAPYLHEAHFGLANANFRLGNLKIAEQELQLAMKHATRSTSRKLYEAKLVALSEINVRQ
jgi:tetratricopeptide (TPR) repeat protein